MSYLKTVGTSIIYLGAILAAITFIPGIPPDANFTEYSIVEPKKLEGKLGLNEKLNNAEILFQNEVKGAESFASFNGELYTGIHGGYVVKVTKNKLVPIVKFGKECDGLWQESKCGRPLGLKFDKKGALYVCDAYYGIYKVDVNTGKYERLVKSEDAIDGKVPKIFNSLDIASNGDIYWTDSSTEFDIQDGSYTMLTDPAGRAIKYNAATKKNQVLVENLAFSNGIVLSEDESFAIILETLSSRIIKYNIKGPKAGKHEIFIEGLPGLPDNVHSDGKNGFLVSLVVYADGDLPQLTQSLTPHPYIRRMLARLLSLLEAPFKCLQSYYPNYYAERIIHYIGGFESFMFLSPKITLVLRINDKGQIIDTAYATDGKIGGISSAFVHNEYLWLGSPFAEYIARVPLKQAFPDLMVVEKITQTTRPSTTKEQKITDKPTQTTPTPTTTTIPTTTSTTKSTTPKPETPKPTTKPVSKTVNEQKPTEKPTQTTTRSKVETPKPSTKPVTNSVNEQKSSQKEKRSTGKN